MSSRLLSRRRGASPERSANQTLRQVAGATPSCSSRTSSSAPRRPAGSGRVRPQRVVEAPPRPQRRSISTSPLHWSCTRASTCRSNVHARSCPTAPGSAAARRTVKPPRRSSLARRRSSTTSHPSTVSSTCAAGRSWRSRLLHSVGLRSERRLGNATLKGSGYVMAIVYCDRCEKVVRKGSGAKVKFNFTSSSRPNESGTFCTACGEALVRSASRKPARTR